MQEFVGAFVAFPKLLFIGANGPAVGLPVTTMPLADAVYASSSANFSAPLVALGQTPEGCSSVTFPALMGHARATAMLVLGAKLTAEAACAQGLVTEVFEDSEFRARLAERAAAAAALPPLAVTRAKALLRGGPARAALDAANEREGVAIKECWLGPEVAEAVGRFLTRGGRGGGRTGSVEAELK